MKILCVCVGGNCRSATLAYMLKYHYGHDALACGIEGNTQETVTMLAEWADRIIAVEPEIKEALSAHVHSKVTVWDVGPDRWFNPPASLMQIFSHYLEHDRDV